MGASQLQHLSTTMDMDIQVAIANRQPGGTAKLLLVGPPAVLTLCIRTCMGLYGG